MHKQVCVKYIPFYIMLYYFASSLHTVVYSIMNISGHISPLLASVCVTDSLPSLCVVQGEVKFKKGIRDVDALRVLQIRLNSSGEYDWIKVCTTTHIHCTYGHIHVLVYTHIHCIYACTLAHAHIHVHVHVYTQHTRAVVHLHL